MNQQYKQPYLLSAFTAGTADVVVESGYLKFGNATKRVPDCYLPNANCSIQLSMVETPIVVTVAYTAANTTVYAFNVMQYNRNLQTWLTYPVIYTSDASGTDAEIAAGLSAAFNAQTTANGGSLNANIAGAATPLTVYGGTGDPIIVVQASSNVTVDTSPTTATTAVAPEVAIVSSTNATPIVVTTDATTWVVGQSVTISGHATNTNANGTWRVRATNGTTTITLEYMDGAPSVGNGVGGATGIVIRNGINAIGTYALVSAVENLNGTASASSTYTTVTINGYSQKDQILVASARAGYQQVIYLDEVTDAGDYATELVALRNVLNGLDVGGTVANPELIAVMP